MVIHKGGDAAVYKSGQAVQGYGEGCAQFQATVGQLTGDASGSLLLPTMVPPH